MTLCSAARIEALEPRRLLSVVPAGFTQSLVADGIYYPTAMAFAPDGRLFICQQWGQVRIIENGRLLSQPFFSIPVDANGERGLLGIAFDPRFSLNHYVYLYHTVPGTSTTPAHNQVSRVTANGDVAVAGSQVNILDLDPLSTATNHNGGALHFGLDGKLYIGVGENKYGPNAQSLSNLLGKLLRINPDGSIPTDNPFYYTAAGKNRAIWALGLRNPFTFNVEPRTGRIFIDDVGLATWEEIDDARAGANYGWPLTEGPFTQSQYPNFTEPLYAYPHGINESLGEAITGGTFYDPLLATYPSSYVGKYFFSDYGKGFIDLLNPATRSAATFGTGFAQPVDLEVGPDGALYVLEHDGSPSYGAVVRIQAVAQPVTLSAAADAYVRDGIYGNTNYGSAPQLITKQGTLAGYDRRAYVSFDLSAVSSVNSAVLRVFGALSQFAAGQSVGVFAVPNSSWAESQITWNNAPAFSGSPLATITVASTTPQWYQFNLSSYVQQQKAAGHSRITLMLASLTTSTTAYVAFNSREAGNGPQLVVS